MRALWGRTNNPLWEKTVRLEQSWPRYKHSLQISEVVDYHKHLRAHAGASDMEVMVWDTELVPLPRNHY